MCPQCHKHYVPARHYVCPDCEATYSVTTASQIRNFLKGTLDRCHARASFAYSSFKGRTHAKKVRHATVDWDAPPRKQLIPGDWVLGVVLGTLVAVTLVLPLRGYAASHPVERTNSREFVMSQLHSRFPTLFDDWHQLCDALQ